ncbi:hemolysin family protein [Fundidesulfovibrio agrisoli]|uniref:hemolysin family protein n=1 Tax=Fundidesulfovibrio agrisoli TaxID=2922717 RepID=UPI001FAD4A40|nr:hemolysin family protein [Fundidesulfovibrio agrisoli]
MTQSLLQSCAVALLIVLNGFFVAAEMAVVTSRRALLIRRADRGDKGARAALDLADNPEGFLATLQIAITLLTILSGAYGEASLAHHATEALETVPMLAPYAKTLGFGLVVAGITVLTLVLGELVPKRLAIAHPEAVACALARPMRVLLRIARPAAAALSAATRLVLRLMGAKVGQGSQVSEEEIKLLVRQAAVAGVLEEVERDMLERVMRLGDRPVGTLMTHRSRIAQLDLDDPEAIPGTIARTPFNRFPVTRGGLENLLGVAEAKDLLATGALSKPESIAGLLVSPPHVPENSTTFNLLEQLRQAGQNMAVVVDEFGDIQGLVTFTDVLGAVVGEGSLGRQGDEPRIVQRQDGSWLVDAMTPAVEVYDLLGLDRPEHPPHTLAGLVLRELGAIPSETDWFVYKGYRFEVVDMDGRRVDKVLVQKIPDSEGDEE